MHTVEVPGFSGPVLVFPIVRRRVGDAFFEVEQFFFLIKIFLGFRSIERFRSQVRPTSSFLIGCLDNSLSSFRNETGRGNCPTLGKLL
jgi:hypothetical protein